MNDLPGWGDPATWPRCTGHPNDPRTEDDGREEWESDNAFTDFLDAGAVEEILVELLHGDPAQAKADLEKATEAAFQAWIAAEQQQAEEDRAADLAEARAWARDAA